MSKQALLKEMEADNKAYDILENDIFLKEALTKGIEYLGLNLKKPLMFVNITFNNAIKGNTVYSGFEYIKTLRAEKGDKTPVIFYGFESPTSLKKRLEASILNSPAVEYIRMPFSIDGLLKMIKRLLSYGDVKDGLDEYTKKQAALKKLSILKHDVLNAISTVQIAYKLKRTGSEDIQRRNWDGVRTSFFKERDKISEIITTFDANNKFGEILSSSDIVIIEKSLQSSVEKYRALIKYLDTNSKNKDVIISTAESIEDLMNEILRILKEIKL